jgi:hypothetical protein
MSRNCKILFPALAHTPSSSSPSHRIILTSEDIFHDNKYVQIALVWKVTIFIYGPLKLICFANFLNRTDYQIHPRCGFLPYRVTYGCLLVATDKNLLKYATKVILK